LPLIGLIANSRLNSYSQIGEFMSFLTSDGPATKDDVEKIIKEIIKSRTQIKSRINDTIFLSALIVVNLSTVFFVSISAIIGGK
jgi:hypothetical protein